MSDLPVQNIVKQDEIKEPIINDKPVINESPSLTRYQKIYKLTNYLEKYGITFDGLMINSCRKIHWNKIKESEVDIKMFIDVPDSTSYPAEYLYSLLYPFLECQNIMFEFNNDKSILIQYNQEVLIYNSIDVDSLLKYMEEKKDQVEYRNKLDYILVPIQVISSGILGYFLGRAIARSL